MVVLLLRTGPVDLMSSSLMKGYVWGAGLIAVITWLLPPCRISARGMTTSLVPTRSHLSSPSVSFWPSFSAVHDRSWNLAAILLAITLLRTLSKTTIVAFIAGEALLLIRDSAITRRKLLAIVVGSAWSSLHSGG